MTAGVRSYGSDGYSTFFAFRSWSGVDGRYEWRNGKRFDKWNNYTCTTISLVGVTGYYNLPINISGGDITSAWGVNDDLKMQSRLVQAVRGHSFNMAVAVAEGHETISMVASTSKALASVFTNLRHGNFAGAVEALRLANERHVEKRLTRGLARLDPYVHHRMKQTTRRAASDISGRWLELQYGWLPLLNDCYEAGTAFAAIADRPRCERIVISAHKNGSYNASQSPTNWSGTAHLVERRKIIYELAEDPSIQRSLGLYDPLSVVWEKIPYSFVVDWFIPIGTYLDNYSFLGSLHGRTMTYDYRSSLCVGEATRGYYGGSKSVRRRTVYTRSVSGYGPIVATPQLKALPDSLSPRHVYNALALVTQSILSHTR